MIFFKIDKEKCIKDGICAEICPVGLIALKEDYHSPSFDNADKMCIKCGHCVAVCPTGSISLPDMLSEDCSPLKTELKLNQKQCEHFLKSRRSIRVYQKKSVERKRILELLKTVSYAPSGHNTQCTKWMIIDNKEKLNKLSILVIDWMKYMLNKQNKFAVSMNMDQQIIKWEEGIDGILRNAPVLIITYAENKNRLALSTCTIALSYLELAAVGMGLGTCWAGYFHMAATNYIPLIKALEIPENHQCYGSMMLGYPKFNYQRIPLRKNPDIKWID